MPYNIEGEYLDFIDAPWDLAILIDSCRYDDFEKFYRNYFNGTLKKAISHCTCTRDFMLKYLDRSYIDMVFINRIVSVDYWLPNTKFFKRVDIWKTHWDYDKWGTMLPWDVTNVALSKLEEYPGKRMLVCYTQPHTPYLIDGYEEFRKTDTPEACLKRIDERKRKWERGKNKYFRNFTSFYQGVMRNKLGYERAWKLMLSLGIQPEDTYGKIYKKFGYEGLVEGYRKNLVLVLNEVYRLLKSYKGGRVLITTDHSQHYDGGKKGLEKEHVPWLEVEL